MSKNPARLTFRALNICSVPVNCLRGAVVLGAECMLIAQKSSCRTLGLVLRTRNGRPSQLVRPLIFRMAGMARHPDPANGVARHFRVQYPPQVLILDRFLVGGFPAFGLPAQDPFR